MMHLQMKSWTGFTLKIVSALLIVLSEFSLLARETRDKGKERAHGTDSLFSSGEILLLRLKISDKEMETLRKYQWKFGRQTEREKVQITVREGANLYTNVSVQLKGAAGSFRSIDDRPAFTLNFDRNAKRQTFHGLKKLSLNNSVQDPTYLSEQFCREMFLKTDVPTPRAAHARVELNGRDLGLYVLMEGWDKEFLKRHFKDASGNLYDGGFIKDVTDELSTNSGDPTDQSDRLALAAAAREPNPTNRLARLEAVLDVDRFLTFMALDVMLWDWDGYPMNRNNWRLFHDRSTGKMVFMPHGMDQMFWKPEGSVLPTVQGLIAQSFIEIPELRKRYLERMRKLRSTVFNVDTMTNRVREIASRVIPVLTQTDPDSAKQYPTAVADFTKAIVRRGQSLDEQLAQSFEPAAFDVTGVTRLKGWQSKREFGRPEFSPSVSSGGEPVQIGSRQGSSIGTWRSGILLERGRYRVEGRVKTQGLVMDPGDSRGGARLRVKSARSESPFLGDSEWKTLDLEFQVSEPLSEVQVVCEYRGAEGNAWFDLDSIRVKRLPATK
ncbi:MAG: hypothetical protein EXS36_04375 [Pedosphaera sp.]|nr:hypothetical protein [Pedosphaera sp.]